MKPWAIVNANMLDGTGRTWHGAGLLVDAEGMIRAVDVNYQPPSGVSVIDAGGGWLLPGLVDAHSHLGLSTSGEGPESHDGNETTEAVTADVRALDGVNPMDPAIREALANGVTSAYITMGSGNVLAGIGATVRLFGQTVDEMVMVPAAGMKAAMGENPKRVHGQGNKRRPISRPGVAAVLREWLERARRYASQPPTGVKDWDPKLEALSMVVRGDLPLRVHCHRTDDIMTAHRIASEFGLRWVIDHGTEAHLIVDHVSRWDVPAVIGPSFGVRSKPELRQKTFATPGILARAGIATAICSDHPVVPAQYLALYAGLAVREGMPEDLAIRAVTQIPASIIGVGDRVGSLEAGKEADLALWNLNPLTHLQARPDAVYVGGELVAEH